MTIGDPGVDSFAAYVLQAWITPGLEPHREERERVGVIYRRILRVVSALSFALTIAAVSNTVAGELTGKTVDIETGQVIRDVNVRIVGLNKVEATSKQGIFEFRSLPDSTYRVVATHVAYDSSDTLTVAVTGYTNLNIALHPKPWVINEVVVTGTRSPHLLKDVPVQTEVVTRRDFQRTGSKTVDEALASSIGLTISEGFSGAGATIRGVEGDRVLVLIDGEAGGGPGRWCH